MDNETAKILFEDGATLVFLDVPEGTEFGVDYTSWNVGPKFKGLKMVPPGVHFIYYSACNQSGQTSPRTGFFHNFKKREILIKKWDRRAEDISTVPIDPDEYDRVSANKKDLDQFLGPYPYENYKTWVALSGHVTDQLVDRLQPTHGRISAVTEFVSERSDTQSRRAKMDHDCGGSCDPRGLPVMEVVPGSRINFSPVGRPCLPCQSSPAQITQNSLDSTLALDAMLNSYQSPNDILGEIQFAFICFLIGQVGDAFDQWKKLVHLLSSSARAVLTRPELYMKFITLLFYELKEIPEDFFVDIVSNDNFLVSTLHGLFLALENEEADAALRRRGLQFRLHLTKKFKWDFTEEPSDEAPVIVELENH